MMKYHFFRRLRPHSRAGCCTCKKKKKRARNAHHSPNRIRVHWSGEARARPRDANFLRGAGGNLAELFSVCVCNGAPPKNHDFWKIAYSFSSFRQLERYKTANKHVCEKVPCSSFSNTPSTTSAERFGSLESSFEHFETSCLFWVEKRGDPQAQGLCGPPSKARAWHSPGKCGG